MDLIKLFSTIFKHKKHKENENKHFPEPENVNNLSPREKERIEEARKLDNQKMQEMRIAELEKAVQDSFLAVGYYLTNMDKKTVNVASFLSNYKELSKSEALSVFEKGVNICDRQAIFPLKMQLVVEHFYKNYYSPEKQLQYYDYKQNVKAKYKVLEEELARKYGQELQTKTITPPKTSNESDFARERTEAFRALEEKSWEEMRVLELENEIHQSFAFVNYELTYMKEKVSNIAWSLARHKKLSFSQISAIFEKGINICDRRLPNPFKFSRAITHYYKNYYSHEKQLKYYNYRLSIEEKYEALEEELRNKFDQKKNR